MCGINNLSKYLKNTMMMSSYTSLAHIGSHIYSIGLGSEKRPTNERLFGGGAHCPLDITAVDRSLTNRHIQFYRHGLPRDSRLGPSHGTPAEVGPSPSQKFCWLWCHTTFDTVHRIWQNMVTWQDYELMNTCVAPFWKMTKNWLF